MRTILQGCAIALAIAGVCALLEGALLLRDLRRQVDSSSMSVASVAASVNKLLATANDAAEQLREAAAQANQAAKDESGYFQKTSLEVYKTSAAARLVLVRTDHSLNDVLVPQLDASLADTDALLRQTATDLHASTTAIAPTLDSLAQASAAAATAMADPHLRETLSHVDDASAAAAATAVQLDESAKHVDAIAAIAETRFRQLTTPASLTVRILEKLLGLSAEAAQVSAGFIK